MLSSGDTGIYEGDIGMYRVDIGICRDYFGILRLARSISESEIEPLWGQIVFEPEFCGEVG